MFDHEKFQRLLKEEQPVGTLLSELVEQCGGRFGWIHQEPETGLREVVLLDENGNPDQLQSLFFGFDPKKIESLVKKGKLTLPT